MSQPRKAFCCLLLIVFLVSGAGGTAAAEESHAESGYGGFVLPSPDNQWRLQLRGLVHFDSRVFFDDETGDDAAEWLLRRVRPSLEGDLGDRVSFRIMPEFGAGSTSLVDGYMDISLSEGLQLRVGKFKPPVGLERLQSARDLRLVERSVVTELVPNRDSGIQLSGASGAGSWAVGLFNGVPDGQSEDRAGDDEPEVAARLILQPLSSAQATLGFGIGATYGNTEGSPESPQLSGYRSPGQNTMFSYREGADGTFADGERVRVVPQFYWYSGPVGLLGEWARVRQEVRRSGPAFDRTDRLEHGAWQLTAEWFVTGERAGLADPEGAGAVQVVARFGHLETDAAAFSEGPHSFADPAGAVREATTWAIGVNWLPTAELKTSLAYQQTTFRGGDPVGDRPDERVLFLRVQLAF